VICSDALANAAALADPTQKQSTKAATPNATGLSIVNSKTDLHQLYHLVVAFGAWQPTVTAQSPVPGGGASTGQAI
jgi:hypothetical protein